MAFYNVWWETCKSPIPIHMDGVGQNMANQLTDYLRGFFCTPSGER